MVQTFANYFQQIMRRIFFTECGTARKNPFSYLLYTYIFDLRVIGKLKASSNSRLALKVTLSQFLAEYEHQYENAYNIAFLKEDTVVARQL